MAEESAPPKAPERVTFAPGEVGQEDLRLIMARTRKGPTDALQWALRFTARYFERQDAAERRGREGRLEWAEADPAKPEDVLWRTALDTL